MHNTWQTSPTSLPAATCHLSDTDLHSNGYWVALSLLPQKLKKKKKKIKEQWISIKNGMKS